MSEIDRIKIENEEDLQILTEIEEKVMNNINLGFDTQVLETLDREDVSKKEIEALKEIISKDIVIRLFCVGNSIYYGRLRAGKFSDFSEIILRLGTEPAKVYILSLSLFFMNHDEEFTTLAARSFIISMLGKMLAKQMGMKDEDVKKVELGGLFLKVGKVFMLLYERQRGEPLDRAFVSKYYRYLGSKMVERFKLPDFLREVLSSPVCNFTENSFNVRGVVQLAHSIVDKNFKNYGKFVIESPMPDKEGLVTSSQGSIMSNQMDAIGLGSFLEIVPTPSLRQPIHQARTSSGTSRTAAY
jgi:RNase H-fold protein (predicted Holliday junction resolvase)